MNLKKCLIALTILSLAGASGLAFAQEDDVLQKAREKYDRSKTSQSAAGEDAQDAVRGETQAAPAGDDAVTAETTTTTVTEDKTITIDVDVKVKTRKPADSTQDQAPASKEKAKPRKNRAIAFQWVPGLPDYSKDSATIALSPIMPSVGEVKAVEFGLLLADADKASGLQLSGLGNFARQMDGVELAGLFNITGRVSGLQASGLFNISGDGSGVQTSGLFDISGNYTGVQATGLFNISQNFTGVQAAGLFNIAGDVSGVQASGLFNYGKKVKGVQLGLVNIADDLDGVALGLINYSRTGINEFNVWYESNNMLNVSLMTGSKHFYSLIQVGEKFTDLLQNTDSLTAGAGVGFRLGDNDGLHFQADLSARSLIDLSGNNVGTYTKEVSGDGWKTVTTVPVTYTNPFVSVFPSLRLGLGYNFAKLIGIFGGVTLDIDGGQYWSVPEIYRSPAALMFNYNGNSYGAYCKWYAGIVLY